jgi:hypothetical protein
MPSPSGEHAHDDSSDFLSPDRKSTKLVVIYGVCLGFGTLDSPSVDTYTSPPIARASMSSPTNGGCSTLGVVHRNALSLYGKPMGVQGHSNSCYLDATLFALFAHTDVVDWCVF